MLPETKRRHLGVLSFAGTGHLNPLLALSQEIKSRGHRVTFFESGKIEERIRSAGLDFVPIPELPETEITHQDNRQPGIRYEIAMLRFKIERLTQEIEHYLNETPPAIAAAGVDGLLVDEITLTGPTAAQLLGLPYFLISTSVPHHFGWKHSSWLTGYRYSATALSCLQDWFLELSASRMRGPVCHVLDRFRKNAGFGPSRRIARDYPCLAHITQLAECLDVPRTSACGNFHYTGPWVSSRARTKVDFPWDRLDGRPIVYVTLGTTRNAQFAILRMIAEACRDLDVQLVVALGNRFDPERFEDLPGRPIITKFAPQLELLKVASVVITHGGANSSFEALMEAVPMVVIPIAFDQPAVAARVRKLKVAEVLPIMRLSADKIRQATARILTDPRCREAARRIQTAIRATRGCSSAADIITVKLSDYMAQREFARRAESHDPQHSTEHDAVIAS